MGQRSNSCVCCACCSGETPEELQVTITNGFTGLGRPGCLKLIAASYVTTRVTQCSWVYNSPVDEDGGTVQVAVILEREFIAGQECWVLRVNYNYLHPDAGAGAGVVFSTVVGEARPDCVLWDDYSVGQEIGILQFCVPLNQIITFAEVTAL